jgi:hypothetical protein
MVPCPALTRLELYEQLPSLICAVPVDPIRKSDTLASCTWSEAGDAVGDPPTGASATV